MSLGMELALSPGDSVLDGDPALPSTKWGGASKFSAHVYCGQTAGWIKMSLDTEVDLGPGYIVLHGELAPLSQKGGRAPPPFSSHFYGIF